MICFIGIFQVWKMRPLSLEFFFADVAEQIFILDHKNAQVDIYVAGFPCKAFSALRAESNWLADAQARQFYKCAETAEVVQPRAFRKHLDLPSIFVII